MENIFKLLPQESKHQPKYIWDDVSFAGNLSSIRPKKHKKSVLKYLMRSGQITYPFVYMKIHIIFKTSLIMISTKPSHLSEYE